MQVIAIDLKTNPKKIYKNRNHGERGEILVLAIMLSKTELLFLNSNDVRILCKVKIKDLVISLDHDQLIIENSEGRYIRSVSELNLIIERCLQNIKHYDHSELINFLGIKSDKSSCWQKQDIEVQFSDSNKWEGYSIKTFTGANPTLFNASQKAVFKYSLIDSRIDDSLVKKEKYIKDKVRSVLSQNSKSMSDIISLGPINSPLETNLNLISADYAQKFGTKLINSFMNDSKYFKDNFTEETEILFVKEFLWMSCLGMVPSVEYEIDNGNNCGLILFDGEFLYIFKDGQELKDFLFNHSKFDSPSTKRYPMVSDFQANTNTISFGITLQIRLTYPKNIFKK